MKVRAENEWWNPQTGERYDRVVGDGESRLVPSIGSCDCARLGPRRETVFGPREDETSIDDVMRHAEKILKEIRAMHDAKGRPLQVGDQVLVPARITSVDAQADYCNVTIESAFGRRPDGLNEKITTNTGILLRANGGDENDIEDAFVRRRGPTA